MVSEIAMLMCYDATRDFKTVEVEIENAGRDRKDAGAGRQGHCHCPHPARRDGMVDGIPHP